METTLERLSHFHLVLESVRFFDRVEQLSRLVKSGLLQDWILLFVKLDTWW